MNSNDSAESDVAEKSRRPDHRIWTIVLVSISLVAFYQFRNTPQVIMAQWHAAAAQKADGAAKKAEDTARFATAAAEIAAAAGQAEEAATQREMAAAQSEAAAQEWARAFTEMDKAIARNPSDQLYARRSLIHRNKGAQERVNGDFDEARGEFELALADIDTAIELNPSWQWYPIRAVVHESLDQFRKSAQDWTLYLQAFPDLASPYESDTQYAEGLNGRAYMRALGDFEIDKGLADIDKALRILPESAPQRYTFLDTQAYLMHKNGDSERALPILEQCVAKAERFLDEATPAERGLATETLAVLIHHRGEVCEALGEQGAAAADFRRARELGFDPERGIR